MMTKIEIFPDSYPSVLRLESTLKAKKYREIEVPTCLRNTLYIKALSCFFSFKDLRAQSSNNYGKNLSAVFSECSWDSDVDELMIGPNISAAIKRLRRTEKSSYNTQQYTFFTPLKWVVEEAHPMLLKDELMTLTKMLNNTVRFAFDHNRLATKAKPSIQDRYPKLPYTNKDYVSSLREIAFVTYEVWERVRTSFKTTCPNEYNRLLNILRDNRDWIFPLLQDGNLGVGSADIRRFSKEHPEDVLLIEECTKILIRAALKMDDPIFIEALFMDLALKASFSGKIRYIKECNGKLKISSHVTLGYMKGFLRGLFQQKDSEKLNKLGRYFSRRSKSSWYHRVTSGPLGTFTPYALLFPYGTDELQIYSALIATDRHQLSNQKYIQTEDILLSNSDNEEVHDTALASRLKLITKKNRSDTCEGDVYARGSGFYKVMMGLKKQFTWAYDAGLLPESHRYLLISIFDDHPEHKMVSNSFYDVNFIAISGYGTRIRTHAMLIEGAIANRILVKNIENKSALTIMQQAMTRIGADKSSQVFTVNEITQSRIGAEAAEDLSNFQKSLNMDFNYSENAYGDIGKAATNQHHSLDTRLDVYYLKSTDKVKVGKLHAFAAQVGEEMMKMADTIALRKASNAEIISAQKAKEICGLAESEHEFTTDQIMIQAQAEEALINETGFISKQGKTYIIKSPLHAELIKRKIDHIDEQIDKLFQNNHHLVPNAVAQRMMLAVMLTKFDEVIKKEGMRLYGKSKLPFPDLTVSLGGF